jgi:hypothetical protein
MHATAAGARSSSHSISHAVSPLFDHEKGLLTRDELSAHVGDATADSKQTPESQSEGDLYDY